MMPATLVRPWIHPLHAILLSFPVALFASALASDITYFNSGEVQWSNLSQWAITGGLVFGAPVLGWAVFARVRARGAGVRSRPSIYLILICAMWIVGLLNAFKHSQDAWSSVEAGGLLLSILSTMLALAAAWVAHSEILAGDKA